MQRIVNSSPVLIELFYDVISPYSWLAFEVLGRYKSRWNVKVHYKPAFLGGIMKESENRAPAMVPNKAVYMHKDLQRLSKYFDVEIAMPSNFFDVISKGTLQAQRLLTVVDMTHPEYLEELSRNLWKRIYIMNQDVTEGSSFREAAKKAGMNETIIEDALSKIADQKTKDRLLQYTREAIQHGAFGMPYIVAHVGGKPEPFFGSDRFELLANMLGERWDGPTPDKIQSKI